MLDLDVRKVKKNIKILENLEARSLLAPELAHKLALIECCGWIEEKMHYTLMSYVERKVGDTVLQEKIKDSIRNTNYSFNYSAFKEKLVATLGQPKVIKIEGYIQQYDNQYFDFDHFKQFLAELKKKRDECAHTYSRIGIVMGFGFSQIEERLNYVNTGLNIFQSFIRRR